MRHLPAPFPPRTWHAPAAGGGIGLRGLGGDCPVIRLERDYIRAKIGGGIARPDRLMIGTLGHVDARAHHVELILQSEVHYSLPFLFVVFDVSSLWPVPG